MPIEAGSKSIAEILAEAEKQKIEQAKRAAQEYAQRRQAEAQAVASGVTEARKIMSGAAMGGKTPGAASRGSAGKTKPAAATAPAKKSDDLLDEFDVALEAVQAAKKSLGNDTVAIEKMAVNIVMAKTGLSRDEAPRYVRKAINYLNG